MRLKYLCLAAAVTTFSLSSCSFGSNIDNLMTPPKLSVEQEQIYKALTEGNNTSISLKYPKSGKYLSAFIIEDLDGDGGSEAIVFYEHNGIVAEENSLRLNILDQEDGKWRSIGETSVAGTEIEKVMISKLGTNNRVNIIIGSSLINRSEKNVTVYTYDSEEGTIDSDFSQAYAFIDVTDLDSDNENEFLLLTAASNSAPATASVYELDENGRYICFPIELSGSFTEFNSLTYGNIGGGRNGLCIDELSGTGAIQTDMIYMNDSQLYKVFNTPDEAAATLRPAGYSSADIDNDGTIEIPLQTIAPGYDNVPESEQMSITQWKVLNKDNRLVQKYSSYYSVSNGYTFIFPERWHNNVTVRRDAVNDEIVFCAYSDGEVGEELMRIFCADDAPSREDRLFNGYMLMGTKGGTSYLAYIPQHNKNDVPLAPTAGEAAVGFKLM